MHTPQIHSIRLTTHLSNTQYSQKRSPSLPEGLAGTEMGEHPVLVSHQVEAARTSSRAAAKPRHSMPCSCLLALSVLLLGCCHLCSCQLELQQAAEEPRVVFGQLQVIILHEREAAAGAAADEQQQGGHDTLSSSGSEHPHVHALDYFLRVATGQLMKLRFPKPPKQMPRTGAYVMVRVAPGSRCNLTAASGAAGAGDSSTLCVSSMMAQEAAPRDMIAASQPRGAYKFKALVMQLQVCGKGPATSTQSLEAALFDGLPNSQQQTVQGAFKSCSYGNADFSRESVEVVTVTVPIPCKGSTPWNMPYDSSTCPYVEWSDTAHAYLGTIGIKWQDYKHKLYVVPPGDLCSWGGMGYVGCTQDCRVWISGDLWQYPTTWLHELGHNLYMNHAGSYQDTGSGSLQFVSYKDDSGAMGHCCSMRCFNAPHTFQVGWSKPMAVLHKDNMAAGVWTTYVLPPRQGASSSDSNMLRVLGDWNGRSAAFNMFIEYRSVQSYDSGLLDSVRNKVTLYSTAVGDAMPYTTLEAAVGPGQILRESRLGSQLTVWVGSLVGDSVRVHLCRPESATETDCADGKDNDCDGYTDGDDTDCKVGPTRRLLGAAPLMFVGDWPTPPTLNATS